MFAQVACIGFPLRVEYLLQVLCDFGRLFASAFLVMRDQEILLLSQSLEHELTHHVSVHLKLVASVLDETEVVDEECKLITATLCCDRPDNE